MNIKFENVRKNPLIKNSYISFTVLFAFILPFLFLQFALYKKSILVGDGLNEHTAFLAFYGGWLRKIASNFIHGNFKIPTFSFSLGFGADVISTLSWFCVGDPLNLLAVFFPKSCAYGLFVFLAVLRLYLLGISFTFYAREHGFSKRAVILGALSYSFSGYAVFVGLRHPYFLNPMIYLPLLCLGIDRIFANKKPFLFVASLFFACVSNYYFFYMLSIFVFIYALVRYFFAFDKTGIKSFFEVFLKTFSFYLLGVAMAAVILLPNIYGFLTASRTTEIINVPLLYDLNYYANLFFSPVAPSSFGSYGVLGFSAPLLIASVFLFTLKDKTALQLKIFISIGLVFFCLPILAHITNGFNYLTNRWSFAFAFPVCFSFVYVFEKLCVASKKELKIPLFLVLVQNLLILVACAVDSNIRQQYILCYCFSLTFIAILYFLFSKRINPKKFIFASVIFGLVLNSTVRFSPYGLNYLEKYNEKGIYSGNFKSNTDIEIKKLESEDFFRYDEENKFSTNNAAIFGTHGTNYYYSTVNIHLTEFNEATALATTNDMSCHSLNRRRHLQDLFAVKYFVLPSSTAYTPESMAFIKEFNTYGGKKKLYKIENDSAFAQFYTTSIDASDLSLKNLTPLEKQEVFAQTAVIYDDNKNQVDSLSKFDFAQSEIKERIMKKNISFSFDDGIRIEGNKILVSKKGARLGLDFSGEETYSSKKELYLLFKNLVYTTDKQEKPHCSVVLNNSSGEQGSYFQFTSANDSVGHTKMPCFGLQDTSSGKFYVNFEYKGEYEFEEISVFALEEMAKKDFDESTASSPLLKTNQIEIKANLAERKFARFSVPYSSGWKIFIDGKKTESFRCNAAFLGCFVDSGAHEIRLEYSTPFFRLGAIVSLVGFIIFVLFVVADFKRKKKGE